jgi:hypothetical protein
MQKCNSCIFFVNLTNIYEKTTFSNAKYALFIINN